MTPQECQELVAHVAEASTLEGKVRRFVRPTAGRTADAPGDSASCYDLMESLLKSRSRASREIALVVCMGLTAGVPCEPTKDLIPKTIAEHARHILDVVNTSRDPTHGGNVLPVIRSTCGGSDETRRLLLHGLLSLVNSKKATERKTGQTACLAFLLFAHA
jgi:hypothetical protein